MSVDRNKVQAAAQKFLEKGAFDKAIVEFQKLVKADPSDVRTLLKIGDLHHKLNQRTQAIETYARVADQYASQGFFHKAVAVYRQILNLDPSRLDVKLRLAEMNESMQLTGEAVQLYEHVAAEQTKAGLDQAAVDTYARLVRIDPSNIPSRIKYAEALSRAGRKEDAANAFEAGADLLKLQQRMDDYARVVERLLFHREDLVRARELAVYYLERDDGKRAFAKLQTLFKADPHNIDTLEMLARAFQSIEQLPKTISVLHEIAKLRGERGERDEQLGALRKILTLDPSDADARRILQQLTGGPPAAAGPVALPPGAVIGSRARPQDSVDDEAELVDEFVEEVDDTSGVDAVPSVPPESDGVDEDIVIVDEEVPVSEPPPADPAPAATATVEANIARLLAEVDVFHRYGLRQRVVEQLRHILSLDPRHHEARVRLKDALLERGEMDAAAQELVTLAQQVFRSEPARAVAFLRDAQRLDPDNPEVSELLIGLEPVVSQSAPPLEAERTDAGAGQLGSLPDPSVAAAELSDPEQVVELSVRKHPTQEPEHPPTAAKPAFGLGARGLGRPPAKPGLPKPAFPKPAPLRALGRPVAGPPAPRPSHLPSAEPMFPRPEASPPAPDDDGIFFVEPSSSAAARLSSRAPDPLAPMSPEEFERAPLTAPGSRRAVASSEVEDLLDEADFFLAQGLHRDALALLRDALTAHPTNRLLLDKIAEAEESERSQPPPTAPAVDKSFELASKLADEVGPRPEGSDVLDVETVFAQFKKGVEQQVALDDVETHFDLGIAYKEMGLLADAIHEFELCTVSPTRACMAYTVMGMCWVEKGDFAAAIESYEKGLRIAQRTEREETGLYYEMGRAFEAWKRIPEAIEHYRRVLARDPSFANVDERIRALTSAPVERTSPSMQPAEVDAAFDELVGKE